MDISPPEPLNFAQHLFQVNAGRATKIAYVDDRGSLSYGQLEEGSRRFAAALLGLGIRREERVLLLMLDANEWPIAFLGCLYAGIVPVAVNTLLTADDYAYMLAHSRAQAAIVSASLAPLLGKAMGQAKNEVKHLIVAGAAETLPAGALAFDSLLAASEPLPGPAATPGDDPAFWLFSSGSTGKPKGTVHTHANAWWTAELYGKRVLGLTEADVCFSAAKLYFAYGLGNALSFPLAVGATVLLMAERPTPDAVFKRWTGAAAAAATGTALRPTVFFGAPTGFAGMLASPGLPGARGGGAAHVLLGRRGVAVGARPALRAPFRRAHRRRHRLDRDAARLPLQPGRRHPLRHHRQAGRGLRDRTARRGRPTGRRRRGRRPLHPWPERRR